MRYLKGFFWGVVIATMIVGVAVLFGWIFMMLWNWLIPELFNGPYLTFWQAVGLLLLSKILFGFGGKKGGSHGGGKWKRHWSKKWGNKWEERCSNMTEEDRNRWKQHFMNKWDCYPEKNRDTSQSAISEETNTVSDS